MIRKTTPHNAKTELLPIQNQIFAIVSAGLCAALCGCGTVRVSSRHEIGAAPKPAMIYVADFDLDASNIKFEPGVLPALPKLPGPLGDVLPPLPGAPKNPHVLARDAAEVVQRTKQPVVGQSEILAVRASSGAGSSAALPHPN